MMISFRIFHPIKPKHWNLTFSEKLSYYSLAISLLYFLILWLIEKFFSIKINQTSYIIPLVGFGLHFISTFIRYKEHENLNGSFEGNLIFDENWIKINDTTFDYSAIKNLDISYADFYGKRTENTKSGPYYKNGTSNKISIQTEKKSIECYFEISSKREIEKIAFILFDIISNEKIIYQRKYLNLIDKDLRHINSYKNLISKLIKEKKLNCTEGLLLIGYDSDAEAKELRAKYCS